jgi:hypothetical protein
MMGGVPANAAAISDLVSCILRRMADPRRFRGNDRANTCSSASAPTLRLNAVASYIECWLHNLRFSK